LIAFYSELEKTRNYPVFTFPIRVLQINDPVFLVNNASLNEFSKAVEFIKIDTSSFPYDIDRGYIYRANIQQRPLDEKQ